MSTGMQDWNKDVAKEIYTTLEGDLPLRILELLPGTGSDPIHCRLVPTRIDLIKGRFEATSYTWGRDKSPVPIVCNGKTLNIQPNAFHMLNDLRLPNEVRTVWVDAICINQGDKRDRTAQVSAMHFVYSLAKAVIIWIGRPDESSGIAMKFAGKLDAARFIKEYEATVGLWGVDRDEAKRKKTYIFDPNNNGGLAVSQDTATALVKFMERPWFSRIWVLQEASACPDTRVICGGDTIPWDNLFALGWILTPSIRSELPSHLDGSFSDLQKKIFAIKRMQTIRTYRFPTNPDKTLIITPTCETLLLSAQYHESTDPRDKIYTIKSLLTFRDHIGKSEYLTRYPEWLPGVDYDIPWEALYASVTQQLLCHGVVNMLSRCGKARHPADWQLPSWVVDYRGLHEAVELPEHSSWMAGGPPYEDSTSMLNAATAKVLPKSHRRRYDAARMSPDFSNPEYKGRAKLCLFNAISFRIFMRDEIVWAGSALSDLGSTSEGYLTTRQIRSFMDSELQQVRSFQKANPTYMTGEAVLDAYKLTLIAGMNHRQDRVGAEYVEKQWGTFIERNTAAADGRGPPLTENTPLYVQAMNISSIWNEARFAITKHGYFCLVPSMAAKGDTMAVIKGHRMPAILRPYTPPRPPKVPSNEEYFELIGDGYVHGLMHNEAGCLAVHFGYKEKMTDAQRKKLEQKEFEDGDVWEMLGFGDFSRVLPTIRPGWVNIV
ncbi:heterokaryon incompatibility protein-domain-containing protein [Plectosphaerella plurivora]|uniref:Heterokaryon incompatibility protein-domain-containing protein n=1 Tax=Plectosphaerella plurivora TaxID=936078 RepID=A0A9P8VD71_9PEZI|nr:heterokaryon incompatibility protein-domain-containing protein [Plectosphaerella plurivora]